MTDNDIWNFLLKRFWWLFCAINLIYLMNYLSECLQMKMIYSDSNLFEHCNEIHRTNEIMSYK
jgi:hypothetical protein